MILTFLKELNFLTELKGQWGQCPLAGSNGLTFLDPRTPCLWDMWKTGELLSVPRCDGSHGHTLDETEPSICFLLLL